MNRTNDLVHQLRRFQTKYGKIRPYVTVISYFDDDALSDAGIVLLTEKLMRVNYLIGNGILNLQAICEFISDSSLDILNAAPDTIADQITQMIANGE
ncbi:MAG: hypothetical protein ACI4GD_08895 [Lachnospiraceae bacterium]